MDYAAEAINAYEFGETLINAILNESLDFLPAFEADTTTTTGENKPEEKKNENNPKGDDEVTPEEKKKSEGFLSKLKAIAEAVVNLIITGVNDFKSKFTYFFNAKKDFKNTLNKLLEKKKFKDGMTIRNRPYDFTFTKTQQFIQAGVDVELSMTKQLSESTQAFQDFTNNNKTLDELKAVINSNKDSEVQTNPSQAIAKKIGSNFVTIERYADLVRGIQNVIRGSNDPKKTVESEKVTIDAALFNTCKNCCDVADTNLKKIDSHMSTLDTEAKKWKNSISLLRNTKGLGEAHEPINVLSKLAKNLNIISLYFKFLASMIIEVGVNAINVCKKALGFDKTEDEMADKSKFVQ